MHGSKANSRRALRDLGADRVKKNDDCFQPLPIYVAPSRVDMNTILRQAGPPDVGDIMRVRHSVRDNRLRSRAIADEEVVQSITVTGRGWVVEVAGWIVAFAIGNAVDGNIWALFVDPDHEGRGHGRALHDTMVDWLWSRGLTRLWLSTDPATRARRFYERAGWREVGPLPSGEVLLELHAPPSGPRK